MTVFIDKYDFTPDVTKETIVGEHAFVPATAPYEVYLNHIPRDDSSLTVTGYTEMGSTPTTGKFRAYYGEAGLGKLEFHSSAAGAEVVVGYHACGTVVWAEREGINKIQDALATAESDIVTAHNIADAALPATSQAADSAKLGGALPAAFAAVNHNLVDTTKHPVTGLTAGHVLTASGATAYGFAAPAAPALVDDSVTYAKMQDVSATSRLLGRKTAGAGNVEELTGADALTLVGAQAQSSAWNYVEGMATGANLVFYPLHELPPSAKTGLWREVVASSGSIRTARRCFTCRTGSVTFTFTGTAVALVTLGFTQASLTYQIDGGALTTCATLSAPDVAQISSTLGKEQIVFIASGLAATSHTITFWNSGRTIKVYGILAEHSANNHALVAAGSSVIGGVRNTHSAADLTPDAAQAGDKGRCDLITAKNDGTTVLVKGTDGTNEKAYSINYAGVVSQRYRGTFEPNEHMARGWTNFTTVSTAVSDFDGYVLSVTTDQVAHLSFYGTGLVGYFNCYNAAGQIKVTVDGDAEGAVVELYLNSATLVTTPVTLASGLPLGYHTVRLRLPGTKHTNSSDYNVVLFGADVYLPARPAVPAGSVELGRILVNPLMDTVSAVSTIATSAENAGWKRYCQPYDIRMVGANWTTSTYNGPTGGQCYQNANTNETDYALFTFYGTGIRVNVMGGTTTGRFAWTLDAAAEVDNVETYMAASTVRSMCGYEVTGLTQGFHTVKFRATNAKHGSSSSNNILLDSFDVYNPVEFIADTAPRSMVTTADIPAVGLMTNFIPDGVGSKLNDVLTFLLRGDSDLVGYGGNANGDWYRFGNGMQICEFYIQLVYSSVDKLGVTWTFPLAFYVLPPACGFHITMTGATLTPGNDKLGASYVYNVAASNANFYQQRVNGLTDFAAGNVLNAHAYAIGRWK